MSSINIKNQMHLSFATSMRKGAVFMSHITQSFHTCTIFFNGHFYIYTTISSEKTSLLKKNLNILLKLERLQP